MAYFMTGNRNVSSSAGLPKPWMTGWRKSSRWATSTGRGAQAVRTHTTLKLNKCFTSHRPHLELLFISKNASLCWVFSQRRINAVTQLVCLCSCVVSLTPSALPKEYQRIGKAFQNLSSVFTSSGYQGTAMNTDMTPNVDLKVALINTRSLCVGSRCNLLCSHSLCGNLLWNKLTYRYC